MKMKRLGLAGISILVLSMALSACTSIKYGLYERAINREREKAGFSLKTLDLEGKPVTLLENGNLGDKPTLIMLHGFGANKDNWLRFAKEMTADYHLIAVDLPGHGDSFKDMNLRYDIDDQVRYLHEILGQLKVDTFCLAGNSMGGQISCLYAATYPDQVVSLMLFAPGGIYTHESQLAGFLKQGKNPLILENTDDFDDLMDFVMEKKPFIPWPITSVLAEKTLADKAIKEKIFADARTGNHAFVFEDELKNIKAPVLIMWGRQDRVINVQNARIFEKLIPRCKVKVLDGIGHMPMLEDPEGTAALCREFMSTATP